MGKQPEGPGALYGWAMVWTLLGIFAGGMALNLTPCVYPLIPVTISYFGGRSGKRRLIGHGLCYIGGLSITNWTLGVVAALTGGLMGAMLQNPRVLVFVSGILVLMATSLFGLWEMRLPGGLMQAASKAYAGYLATLFSASQNKATDGQIVPKHDGYSKVLLSSYGSSRVRNSMLKSTQPDLINPVRCLTWLNANRVISGMLQDNRNGIICITGPAINTCRVNIQPIPHPGTRGSGPDLIIHLHPN